MRTLYSYGKVEIIEGELKVDGEPLFKSTEDSSDLFLTDCYESLVKDYPKFYKMDRLSKLGFLAVEALLQKQPWIKEMEKEKVAVLVQTAYGSLDTDFLYVQNIQDPQEYFPSPSVFVYTLPNVVIGEICIRNGFKGENLCLASESFDSDLAKTMIEEWFANDQASIVLLGWVNVDGNNYEAHFHAIGSVKEKTTGVFPEPI